MRIGIVGSRRYPYPEHVRHIVRAIAKKKSDAVVVSGGAPGVDSWAAQEADRVGLAVCVYRADWDTHGKAAGLIRNSTIVEDSDCLFVFWDGVSRGTKDTLTKARKANKGVYLVLPKDSEKWLSE